MTRRIWSSRGPASYRTIHRLSERIHRHQLFLLLLLLFASFRLLTLFLFRPGGFIADFSDYDFYYEWGVLTPMGYVAYDNLWTAYPPLFPALMLTLFEWSSRIPPWVEPRLFFHLIFGSAMLLFECGNFVCIYWLGRRLALNESVPAAADPASNLPSNPAIAPVTEPITLLPPGLWPAILYGFLFAPVYTMAGWFESMPLFFMLVGLCLLLTPRAWAFSAVAAGLGFLTKLTPILLLPIAVRWLGARLSVDAARREWFRPAASGNLLRPMLYTAIFFGVVIGVGYPLVHYDLTLAFSSFRVQDIRPPWQTVWALIDGYYGWGLVPLSMRNLEGLSTNLWQSQIPWLWISLIFVLLYAFLYTRSYDWTRVRTPLAFAALSVTLLFLYSKGWSPQFLVWILVFIVLLTPSPRWLLAAVLLTLLNLVESTLYVIMLPTETWLLFGTVILRTLLLILFCAELLLQLWPRRVDDRTRRLPLFATLQRGVHAAVWLVLAVSVLAAFAAFPRAAAAYQHNRLAEHSCRDTVLYLQAEASAPGGVVVTQQPDIWRAFYPWLHRDYELIIVDGYDTQERYAETALARLEVQLAAGGGPLELWWLHRSDLDYQGSSPPEVRETFLAQPDVYALEEQSAGPCILVRLADLRERTPLAVMGSLGAPDEGGNISLYAYQAHTDEIGGVQHLVLYWQTDAAVGQSYTVFVHLFDRGGNLIGQQDNLPVHGLAPTDTWAPGALIRDPYAIPYQGEAPYSIRVGLYTPDGRVPIQRSDGTIEDHLVINLAP